MQVTIDPGSGFCFGVKRAIEQAESILENQEQLYCLGDIVHNKPEMKRLGKLGLVSADHKTVKNLKGKYVMFRAHGEPPASYRITRDNNLSLTDATCPIVRKLQVRITKAWSELEKNKGQLVIFGNPDHPETIGLQGQTGGQAIIITDPRNVKEVDPARPVELFAQTTKSITGFLELEKNIRKLMREHFRAGELPLKVHNTICGQISRRIPGIREFAGKHDIIIFVGGKESSNAKVLFRHCKETNPRSWFISDPEELEAGWFKDARSAGISGATSTPEWLMEKVAATIMELTKEK